MNRSELVKKLAKRMHISDRLAEKLVKTFFEELTAALARGERIELRGFGSFEVKVRRAYVTIHPRTGKPLPLPSKRRVYFRPSKKLLIKLNDSSFSR